MRVMDIIIGCFRTDKCPPAQSWRAGRAADILQPVACPGLLESRPLGNEERCAWRGGEGGDWGLCVSTATAWLYLEAGSRPPVWCELHSKERICNRSRNLTRFAIRRAKS